MKRFIVFAASVALSALTFGCGGGDTTENKSTTTSNTTVNSTTKANTNANANANSNKGEYDPNISQADYEKSKDVFAQKAKDLKDKVGTSATDGWLWVKTRGALMAADNLEESKINVDVNNGVIVLRGTVPDQDQVKKADAAAKSVKGSKGVQNQLKAEAGGKGNAPAKK